VAESEAEFVRAKNKLEAVARISQLSNSGPETLGPGSKERKSVFVNLARGLGINPYAKGSTKQSLAKEIAESLGGHWHAGCESIGQTVTLDGLNLLLELAERRLTAGSKTRSFTTVRDEAQALCDMAVASIPTFWDGKKSIDEMRASGSTKWRETEWQGFYFEFCVLGPLINAFGGGPVKIGKTEFDYQRERIWDLKVRSELGPVRPGKSSKPSPLNDLESINQVVEQGGFGLLVLSGVPTFSPEFNQWHKNDLRGQPGPSRRMLKESFRPTRLDAFFIESTSVLEAALENRLLQVFKQGKQSTGEARALKYKLEVELARSSDLFVYSRQFNAKVNGET
jgi:hypothetical protein